MTRIYTSGKYEDPLISGYIHHKDLQDLIDEYHYIMNETDEEEYNLTISKNLDPIKDHHSSLKIRMDGNIISLGYESHDGWCSISTYNVNKGKWYNEGFLDKEYFFDGSLLIINYDRLDDYSNMYEFAESEFAYEDGKEWIRWKDDMGF